MAAKMDPCSWTTCSKWSRCIVLDAGHQPRARHRDHRLAQRCEAVGVKGVSRGCGDGFVELKVRLHRMGRVLHAVSELRQGLPHGLQLPLRPVSGSQGCRFSFHAYPEFQQMQPVLRP